MPVRMCVMCMWVGHVERVSEISVQEGPRLNRRWIASVNERKTMRWMSQREVCESCEKGVRSGIRSITNEERKDRN